MHVPGSSCAAVVSNQSGEGAAARAATRKQKRPACRSVSNFVSVSSKTVKVSLEVSLVRFSGPAFLSEGSKKQHSKSTSTKRKPPRSSSPEIAAAQGVSLSQLEPNVQEAPSSERLPAQACIGRGSLWWE